MADTPDTTVTLHKDTRFESRIKGTFKRLHEELKGVKNSEEQAAQQRIIAYFQTLSVILNDRNSVPGKTYDDELKEIHEAYKEKIHSEMKSLVSVEDSIYEAGLLAMLDGFIKEPYKYNYDLYEPVSEYFKYDRETHQLTSYDDPQYKTVVTIAAQGTLITQKISYDPEVRKANIEKLITAAQALDPEREITIKFTNPKGNDVALVKRIAYGMCESGFTAENIRIEINGYTSEIAKYLSRDELANFNKRAEEVRAHAKNVLKKDIATAATEASKSSEDVKKMLLSMSNSNSAPIEKALEPRVNRLVAEDMKTFAKVYADLTETPRLQAKLTEVTLAFNNAQAEANDAQIAVDEAKSFVSEAEQKLKTANDSIDAAYDDYDEWDLHAKPSSSDLKVAVDKANESLNEAQANLAELEKQKKDKDLVLERKKTDKKQVDDELDHSMELLDKMDKELMSHTESLDTLLRSVVTNPTDEATKTMFQAFVQRTCVDSADKAGNMKQLVEAVARVNKANSSEVIKIKNDDSLEINGTSMPDKVPGLKVKDEERVQEADKKLITSSEKMVEFLQKVVTDPERQFENLIGFIDRNGKNEATMKLLGQAIYQVNAMVDKENAKNQGRNLPTIVVKGDLKNLRNYGCLAIGGDNKSYHFANKPQQEKDMVTAINTIFKEITLQTDKANQAVQQPSSSTNGMRV